MTDIAPSSKAAIDGELATAQGILADEITSAREAIAGENELSRQLAAIGVAKRTLKAAFDAAGPKFDALTSVSDASIIALELLGAIAAFLTDPSIG